MAEDVVQTKEVEVAEAPNPQFDEAVSSYKKAERSVVKNFIQGMISLGKVLHEQREIWKAERQWEKYLEAVGVSVSGANKMINIFEYAKGNLAALEAANVDNWQKVGVFLALPEELRETLADTIDGEKVGTTEFIQEAEKLRSDKYEGGQVKEDPMPDMANLLAEAVLSDIPMMAEKLIESLQEQGLEITKASMPAAEAYLLMSRTTKEIENGSFEGLNKPEAKFWLNKIRGLAREMTKLRY